MPRDDLLKTYVVEEMRQRQEEGCDVGPLVPVYARLRTRNLDAAEWEAFYRQLEALEPRGDFPYVEPSDLPGIREQRPTGPRRLPASQSSDVLQDRILGAWLGRCAGCTLGKPVEGRLRAWIRTYLERAQAYPLASYFPILDPFPEGLALNATYKETGLGLVSYMTRDDDIDYTVLGLHILESRGLDFETEDVGREWLDHLPYTRTYTAERAAYRNLVSGLEPPQTALVVNPYREWIGADIRVDAYGYVCPGWPERAGELAYRDATLSHVKNGIYGAMFMAAMISAALATDDVAQVINAGLSEIPARSRLAELVREVLAWRQEIPDWDTARDRLEARYGQYGGIHTINNAGVVLLALLYGEGDFARTICLAVMGGWDTDCNGATAGSIVGAMLGASTLPAEWIEPLHDTLHTTLAGFAQARILDLAQRTCTIAASVIG